VPAQSVPGNPNTLHHPSEDAAAELGRITDPTTRLWANLFNVRYRMLLTNLAHALHLSGPLKDQNGLTNRGPLREWPFAEMSSGNAPIAKHLMTLPLKEVPDPAGPAQPTSSDAIHPLLCLMTNDRRRHASALLTPHGPHDRDGQRPSGLYVEAAGRGSQARRGKPAARIRDEPSTSSGSFDEPV
jgi:hypothetical protein